jgi:hypothetical protein
MAQPLTSSFSKWDFGRLFDDPKMSDCTLEFIKIAGSVLPPCAFLFSETACIVEVNNTYQIIFWASRIKLKIFYFHRDSSLVVLTSSSGVFETH